MTRICMQKKKKKKKHPQQKKYKERVYFKSLKKKKIHMALLIKIFYIIFSKHLRNSLFFGNSGWQVQTISKHHSDVCKKKIKKPLPSGDGTGKIEVLSIQGI